MNTQNAAQTQKDTTPFYFKPKNPIRIYKCRRKGCKKKFTSELNLKLHKLGFCFNCIFPGCGRSFFFHHQYLVHRRTHNLKSFICPKCYKQHESAEELEKHLINNPEEKHCPCLHKGCSEMFQDIDKMERHMKRKHSRELPFRCDICNATFLREKGLLLHISTKTCQKVGKNWRLIFCCLNCKTRFSLKNQLIFHLKKKVCDWQDLSKVWPKKYGLFPSDEKVIGSHPIKCFHPFCSMSFISDDQVKEHYKTKHIRLDELKLEKVEGITFCSNSAERPLSADEKLFDQKQSLFRIKNNSALIKEGMQLGIQENKSECLKQTPQGEFEAKTKSQSSRLNGTTLYEELKKLTFEKMIEPSYYREIKLSELNDRFQYETFQPADYISTIERVSVIEKLINVIRENSMN